MLLNTQIPHTVYSFIDESRLMLAQLHHFIKLDNYLNFYYRAIMEKYHLVVFFPIISNQIILITVRYLLLIS